MVCDTEQGKKSELEKGEKTKRKQIYRERVDGRNRWCLCPHPVACCLKWALGH